VPRLFTPKRLGYFHKKKPAAEKASYGELAAKKQPPCPARTHTVKVLKKPKDYKLIGKRIHNVDTKK